MGNRGRPKAASTIVNELENSLLYLQIKNDLLSQLKANGTNGKYYEDLVSDYMFLWITKTLLSQDIKNRGVSIKWKNGDKQCGYKKNDSVSELNKTNAQMLKLLLELGLKPTDTVGGDEDDDEL